MRRRMMRLAIAVSFLAIVSQQLAAATIKHLEFPSSLDLTKPLDLPLELKLPCYGRVAVSITPLDTSAVPKPTYVHQAIENQGVPQLKPTAQQDYSWGTDTNRFNMQASSNALKYRVTFTFKEVNAPDSSRLLLIIAGLAKDTKAVVSVPGTLGGEYHLTKPPLACPSGCINGAATTLLDLAGKTLTSSYTSTNGTDIQNTGWALFKPTGTFTTLSIDFDQELHDGLGWTLAYVCEPGLVVRKDVQGAPQGFTGKFAFMVDCMTPQGLVQTPVTIDWPATSVTVPNIPTGSTCKVVESPNLPAPPTGFIWTGTSYNPANGVVVTSGGGASVTATNTMRPCREKCDVRIIKKVEGAPAGFTGSFTGTLSCWINGKLTAFPVKIDYPGNPIATVADLPLGSVCTFEETGRAALPAPYQWLPPIYSRDFGQITLVGACTHELTVTNRAVLCCDTALPGTELPHTIP